jgi:hypothetical protein
MWRNRVSRDVRSAGRTRPECRANTELAQLSQTLSRAYTFGSIKKDVKRKSSLASWKPRKVSASSPPVAVQVPRGVRGLAVKRRHIRCQDHKFANSPFPHISKCSSERAPSGQGRAVSARRSGPLTARTVLRRFRKRERRSFNSIRFLKRYKRNGCICMWQP